MIGAPELELSSHFPARALDMARLAGLSFIGEAPEIYGQDPVLDFPRPIGGAAATAISLCGDAVAEIWRRRTGEMQRPRVSVREGAAAVTGFALQVLTPSAMARPSDWEAEAAGWRAWGARSVLRGENASNPAVGIYRTADDRWIHIHGGRPHLAERILRVLATDPSGIASAILRWEGYKLEEALAAAETCGAVLRTAEEWLSHPQGMCLASLPVVEVTRIGDAPRQPLPSGDAPLAGLRTLDLSVALAGPVCARTLAQHGSEVLHISAPDRIDSQPLEVETGHGKRSAFIDLKEATGRAALAELVKGADVFCQNYRPGGLAGFGFDVDQVAALRPGIIHASINCYGHTGPWAQRRGWEGLAQAATGLTIQHDSTSIPRLAPATFCDYITGYFAARGIMEALLRRADEGGTWQVRTSLCQTGMWLERMGLTGGDAAGASEPEAFRDLLVACETPFGRLWHLPPAPQLHVTPPHWDRPPPLPGSQSPRWAEMGE